MSDKRFFDKLAVFDLDDTLYDGNSHLLVLEAYYDTKLFRGLFFRALWKLLPSAQVKILWVLYNKIPNDYIINFEIKFKEKIIRILNKKKKEQFKILIVSTAPNKLIEVAANKLNIEWFHAEKNGKLEVIKKEFMYDYLFVCTDNETDLDILRVANSHVICCKKTHREFFKRNLDAPHFWED
ncbi:haloacid dehalogenase-like hydrolase [Propionispira raffinosivorans]|uniref:haloacid dehalogenase-like hydrolase n=1 Tax=Propionispira raffinosivorans TaxID=86959 RepID=UPI00036DF8CB|nr:haloacid dehalogenase-like hydrolase [Propionispira raffinosivorans]